VKLLEAAMAAPVAVQLLDSAAPVTPTLSTVPPPAPSPRGPSAPLRPALWASFVDDDEESDEVLAPQTPPDVTKTCCGANVPCSAVDDGMVGNGAVPLAAMPWPPSWASGADNVDEDGEEELVPQTPPASKTFNLVVVMEVGCAAGEHDGWQEVLPRRGPRRSALLAVLSLLGSRVDVAGALLLVTALRFAVIPSGALDALRTVIAHVSAATLGVLSACWKAMSRRRPARRMLLAGPRLRSRSRQLCLVVDHGRQLLLLLLTLWPQQICDLPWRCRLS
jgi:hypothetical protein